MDIQETINEPVSRNNISLYLAILAMAGVAATLVVITFTMFLKSGAYRTVLDIQESTKINGTNLIDYDTTSPVKTADIEDTLRAITNKIEALDNTADYSPDLVTDSALGLER